MASIRLAGYRQVAGRDFLGTATRLRAGSGGGRDSLRSLQCPLLSPSGPRSPVAGTDAPCGNPDPRLRPSVQSASVSATLDLRTARSGGLGRW